MTEVGEDTFSQTPTLVQSAKLYNLFLLAKCLKISDESPLLRQVRFYFEASAPRQHLPQLMPNTKRRVCIISATHGKVRAFLEGRIVLQMELDVAFGPLM